MNEFIEAVQIGLDQETPADHRRPIIINLVHM
jgi:hypothetical protein